VYQTVRKSLKTGSGGIVTLYQFAQKTAKLFTVRAPVSGETI
jgi:hypothetical protein